jgi:hypothetical protein
MGARSALLPGMWSNPQSSEVYQERLKSFSPPYCANPRCVAHNREKASPDLFRQHAKKKIQRFPYLVIRYRCRLCGTTFASSFFTLSYRDKLNDHYEKIEELRSSNWSKRRVARFLGCAEDTVKRKVQKLARWTLLRMAQDASLAINESIAFDGLENFSFSQFDPNNLNHAVGRESYYIYDFNLAPMNRKGRMSPRQKAKKKALEEKHGPYPKNEQAHL